MYSLFSASGMSIPKSVGVTLTLCKVGINSPGTGIYTYIHQFYFRHLAHIQVYECTVASLNNKQSYSLRVLYAIINRVDALTETTESIRQAIIMLYYLQGSGSDCH